MKRSIRTKFTVFIFMVVAAVVLTAFGMNTFGLGSFYRAHKIGMIRSAYNMINELVTKEGSESEKLPAILDHYSDEHNIMISVLDSATGRSVFSTERGKDYLLRRAQNYLFNDHYREDAEVLRETEDYVILSSTDKENGQTSIDCFGFLKDNQTILIMSTPMANLKENVMLANRFLIYAGLFSLFLGIFLVFLMTRQITEPILKLAALSEKMTELDFSARYDGEREDEIGILGGNMNLLSEKLEETIGELKKANEELQEDIRRKEEIDERRREFIANVSHELKTPIALIQGYAEGLNDGLAEDPESRRYYLDVIIDESVRMNTLVKQLLSLSHLEEGTQELSKDRFDICEMTKNLMNSISIMAEEKRASMRFEIEEAAAAERASDTKNGIPEDTEGGYEVIADEFRIEEVISNYLSNAAHHVNEDGEIVVSVRKRDRRIRVTVFNSGSVIPEEDLTRIWDKFYKVDKAHSRSYGGSGIGLSIVKAVMEAHGMPYGAENRDHGVAFWFELEEAENLDNKNT